MASNYTTNYELPLWEPQDSFLRTEFNDANQKIDDALIQLSYIQVAKATLETMGQTLTLDVSDIDFTKFLRVDLFLSIGMGFNGNVDLRLNGITQNHCVQAEGYGGTSNGVTLHNDLGTLYGGNGLISFFTPRADGPVGCAFFSCTANSTSGNWQSTTSLSTQVTWGELTSFDFHASQNLPAGTQAILCGVRK